MFPACFSSSDITTTSLLARVADAPDRLVAIIGDVQRPIFRYRHAHRPPPRIPLRRHEPSQKIFIDAGRVPVLQRYPNHFVTSARRSIPRSVLGGEQISALLLRALRAFIKRHPERSVAWLQEKISQHHLFLQL